MMKILKGIAFCGAFYLGTSALWARDLVGINILEMSTSQKSIVIDQGSLEDVKEGDYGSFFISTGDFKSPKIFLVARGKLIKNFPRKSYWLLSRLYLPEHWQKNGKYLLLSSTDVTRGRPIKGRFKHITASSSEYQDISDYLDKNQNNVPDRLIALGSDYEEANELYDFKKERQADLDVADFETYRKKSGTHYSDDYFDETAEKFFVRGKPVELGDLKKEEDKKLLDDMSKALVVKTNSQKYPLELGLYKNQQILPSSRDLNNKLSIDSVYEESREKAHRKETISPEAIAKMERDNEGWSEDMDDVSLRKYFIRTGLYQEARRRELVINELEGHEVTFHYAGSVRDQSSGVDENYRGLGYALGLGYDLHLSRTSPDLKNWSLQFLLETGVADYDIGGQNARGQEGSYGGYLNYYFVNNPLTLNSFIWLAGLGIKGGSVKMQSKALSKSYTYQALTLPSLQIMTKYRFRAGDFSEDTVNVGASLNAGVVFDEKRLSVVDSLDDNIDGKIGVHDLKYLIGMSVYF